MQFYGRTQMLSQYPLLERLGVIHQLGFDGAEICVENQDWTFNDLDSLPTEELREQAETLGFSGWSFSFHQNYIYNDEHFALTQQAIPLTHQLGTRIFVFSGTRKQTGDRAEWERMIERTRVLVEIAADHDVILAQEFEPNFIVGTTTDLQRLFDEIPSPHLAANMDLGHVFICDPKPVTSIPLIGEKIVHCHISGMPTGLHDHLLPHEGDMDLRAYLRALVEVGFDGGLALDMYKYDYEAVAAESVAYLRDLLAQVVT